MLVRETTENHRKKDEILKVSLVISILLESRFTGSITQFVYEASVLSTSANLRQLKQNKEPDRNSV